MAMEAWSTQALSHANPAQRIRRCSKAMTADSDCPAHRNHKAEERKFEAYPLPAGFSPTGCFGITMVACGSAPWCRGLLHIHKGERIGLPRPKACQAGPLPLSLRIGKAVFGWRPGKAWTCFATSPSPRFLTSKVSRAEGCFPFSPRGMEVFGLAHLMG